MGGGKLLQDARQRAVDTQAQGRQRVLRTSGVQVRQGGRNVVGQLQNVPVLQRRLFVVVDAAGKRRAPDVLEQDAHVGLRATRVRVAQQVSRPGSERQADARTQRAGAPMPASGTRPGS